MPVTSSSMSNTTSSAIFWDAHLSVLLDHDVAGVSVGDAEHERQYAVAGAAEAEEPDRLRQLLLGGVVVAQPVVDGVALECRRWLPREVGMEENGVALERRRWLPREVGIEVEGLGRWRHVKTLRDYGDLSGHRMTRSTRHPN